MSKMTIAQALKRKNRIAEKIKKVKQDIKMFNSIKVGLTRDIDVEASWEQLDVLTNNLIGLKTAINSANQPIQASIFELGELKSNLSFLQEVPCKSGHYESSDRWGLADTEKGFQEYEASHTKHQIEAECEGLRELIDSLQETIDRFNNTTYLDFEEAV
jgi:hypothetical protein